MDTGLHKIQDRLRAAVADRVPLRLCGGGSKDFHALSRQGERLELRGLAGILSYEPSELVITARAGTRLAELEAVLADSGQCLPFEPPNYPDASGQGATLGGMLAAGWSGPARASVGAVRDYVLGVELFNGRAELLRYGGQVMKNVAGYDISRLMAGSWGTLGVITEVSLKVLPRAMAQATICFPDTQTQALERLHAWGAQPLPLNASCWEAGPLQAGPRQAGRLWLRLRGAAAAVAAASQSLGGSLVEAELAQAFWAGCREQTLPWFAQREAEHCLWRLSVPQTAAALPADIGPQLIEWHGGLRWVQARRSAGPGLQALARELGGQASLYRPEAGVAYSAAPVLEPATAALQQLHLRIKQAFDPAGILNPGRTCAAF